MIVPKRTLNDRAGSRSIGKLKNTQNQVWYLRLVFDDGLIVLEFYSMLNFNIENALVINQLKKYIEGFTLLTCVLIASYFLVLIPCHVKNQSEWCKTVELFLG